MRTPRKGEPGYKPKHARRRLPRRYWFRNDETQSSFSLINNRYR